ncbi:MAG: 30S ribosomal protein S6e [Thaumarchaeota archaeon]|nr:30S ribosomal protein S6e [Nitrososphaerota archaeon]MCL5318468.1 30S ribosomal protein S6e [Nitrososphaerota archaeon]
MAKSKLIVADPGTGKSTMYELSDDQFRAFRGLKIGSEIEGSTVGVEGKIKITGGSDSAGFPMRQDVQGGVKKYALLTRGIGFKSKEEGKKKRKMVRGNTITEDIYQINSVLVGAQKKKEPAKKAEETKAEAAAPAEKPAKTPSKEAAEKKS